MARVYLAQLDVLRFFGFGGFAAGAGLAVAGDVGVVEPSAAAVPGAGKGGRSRACTASRGGRRLAVGVGQAWSSHTMKMAFADEPSCCTCMASRTLGA